VARNDVRRSRIDLARSLGLEPDAVIELADTLAGTLPVSDLPAVRDSLIALALDHRPDLHVEQARGFSARRAAAAISAERLPRVALAADYGANGVSLGDAIGTRQIALQVSVPILDGFRREGRQAEQQAVVRASAVRVEELRRGGAAVTAARLPGGHLDALLDPARVLRAD